MHGLLAWAMAGTHLALILFLVAGGFLVWRWPWLRMAHLGVIVVVGTVFLAGADCPLTVWENHFREQAGWDTYDEGFVIRYLIEPLTGVRRLDTAGTVLVVASWLVPSALAYGLPRLGIPRKI